MSSNECPCCFEEITAETGKVVMTCPHVFHFRCIAEWFLTQESNDLPQNCPCCRNEGSDIAKLPPMRVAMNDVGTSSDEDDEDDEDEDEGEEVEDEEGETLDYTRQQIHDVIHAHGGVGVTDAMWDAWNIENDTNAEHLSFDLDAINQIILFQAGRVMEMYEYNCLLNTQGSLAEPIPVNPVPVSNLQSDAPEFVPTSLRIRWTRLENGDWTRQVLNPEEDETTIWGNSSIVPPPTTLVLQTMDAARKIQALFRGMTTRKKVQNMRKANAHASSTRAAAAKIQALFRGHTIRQIVNPARILHNL